MFELKIELESKAEERIDAMLLRLATLPMAEELTVWQGADMNRRYPKTFANAMGTSGTTIIRSRGSKKRIWKKRPKGYVTPKKFRVPGGRFAKRSNRPILRPVLVDMLEDRINDMAQRELQW